ncbi:alpha/beta hydrolase [Deinococcus oregonensis]|uniref:Alpha/beta hydrolase n=1 Tax=Deinococcus oregonensis TaxID=1805970 RepID=A0ABV6ATG5_9DEIO
MTALLTLGFASAQNIPASSALLASFPGAREGFIERDGVRTHYVTVGRGPLVILIHGHPDFWYGWKNQIPVLARTHTVVAIDQRGINLSDQPQGVPNYTINAVEQDLLALLDTFKVSKASLVGHDTGANLAWNFAAHHPERVDKLVVLSLPHPTAYVQAIMQDPRQRQASALSLALAQPGAEQALQPAQILAIANPVQADRAAYQEAFARTRPDAFVAFFQANSSARAATGGTPLPALEPVTVPTLVIHGLNDPFVLPASFATTYQFVKAPSALVMIPGAGHFVQRDAAATVNVLIDDWLRK